MHLPYIWYNKFSQKNPHHDFINKVDFVSLGLTPRQFPAQSETNLTLNNIESLSGKRVSIA